MKASTKDPKKALEQAIQSMRLDLPSPETMGASRNRVESRLFANDERDARESSPIHGCDAVQSLLGAYRRASLEANRALLVRSHLTECATCRAVYARRGSLRLATTPWQSDAHSALVAPTKRGRTWAVRSAAAVFVCVALLVIRGAFFSSPAGERAIVQAVSGTLSRIDGASAERLTAGAALAEGQLIRAGNSPQSLLRLTDGSRVELGERAEISVAMRGHDTTVHLRRGQIIVQAAKRKLGHLYVEAPDCRVAVTGTVFSVLTSLKGSRVSVIEGEVQVAPSTGYKSVLHRGDQVTTTEALRRVPIEREIAWSRNLDEHLSLLRDLSKLKGDWDSIRTPGQRFESKLVRAVPENTSVYVSIPNYGETLSEGYRLFKARLFESAVLKKWWSAGAIGQHSESLDALVGKVRELSSYVGDEIVMAGSHDADEPRVVILAKVKSPGLVERIGKAITLPTGETYPITVVDVSDALELERQSDPPQGVILLVTPELVALSSSRTAVAEVARRLSARDEGAFADSRLGKRVATAYRNGVGLLIGADLEMISASREDESQSSSEESTPALLVFERKVVSGQTLNSGELSFEGSRQGLSSWLAEPSPMGSLSFLTPQASAVAAFLMKRPAELVSDLSKRAPAGSLTATQLAKLDSEWNMRFREDFAESLGSEVAIALDGPLLPQPAWKLIWEVQDATLLERALESLVRRANEELRDAGKGILVIEHEQVEGLTYHRIKAQDTAIPFEANYACVDGYLVMTPTRALLMHAVHAHYRGDHLAQSKRFTTLLPQDGNATVSGLIFQDVLSVVASTLSSPGAAATPTQQQQLEKLSRDSKPTLISFYGRNDRIEMAGVGELLPIGPEALALPGLLEHTFPGVFGAHAR